MVKIIWTGRALKDLEEIGEYIAKDSLKYAKLTLEFILTVHHNRRLLSNNPAFRKK